MSGQGDPFKEKMHLLEYVLHGIKSPMNQRVQLPIMPEVLLRICHVWEQNSREPDIMLWAACTTYFFGLLRSGEIPVPSWQEFDPGAHLCASGDVKLDSLSAPQIAQLNIKSLKDRSISAQGVNLIGKDWQSICAQ